jgi:hypothetical protein
MTILSNTSSIRPDDFRLAVRTNPGDTYEWSKVLLARAHFDGTLELLTAAWGRGSRPPRRWSLRFSTRPI